VLLQLDSVFGRPLQLGRIGLLDHLLGANRRPFPAIAGLISSSSPRPEASPLPGFFILNFCPAPKEIILAA
jgi:hypothetical protein